TSVTSSIIDYKYENGRRYHAYRDGKYMLPNDEMEQDRLDLHHHVYRLILGGALFRAPISKDVQRILDFGCGTGIWAIDMADEFPNAHVTGTDLSPIQPSFVPPNCSFYVDDVESDWAIPPEDRFDFIHGRSMAGGIEDWPKLLGQCLDNLKPGGWLEMQEYQAMVGSEDDPSMKKYPNIQYWVDLVCEGSIMFKKTLHIAKDMKQWMIDAGFEDVREEIYKVPCGTWPKNPKLKQLGLFQREQMCLAVESFAMGFMTRVLNWTNEECQVLLAKARTELRDPKAKLITIFHFVYGRKPLGSGPIPNDQLGY
ncbi:methyltransferase, partial [Tothia fuscella]